MSRWYRAYEGTVTDAKLGEVALVAECSRSVAIAAWHAILERAAVVNDAGRFDTTPRRVAVILCESPSLIERVFAEMTEIGMIADGAVNAWGKRQYESDNSTERSRKHREQSATHLQRRSNVAQRPQIQIQIQIQRQRQMIYRLTSIVHLTMHSSPNMFGMPGMISLPA